MDSDDKLDPTVNKFSGVIQESGKAIGTLRTGIVIHGRWIVLDASYMNGQGAEMVDWKGL